MLIAYVYITPTVTPVRNVDEEKQAVDKPVSRIPYCFYSSWIAILTIFIVGIGTIITLLIGINPRVVLIYVSAVLIISLSLLIMIYCHRKINKKRIQSDT